MSLKAQRLGSFTLHAVQRLCAGLAILLVSACAGSGRPDAPVPTPGELDRLLDGNETVALLDALQRGPRDDAAVMDWLQHRAEAGHVVPMLELADRQRSRDGATAMKWAVQGWLSLDVDEAWCRHVDRTRARDMRDLLESRYRGLTRHARKHERDYHDGLDAALLMEEQRSRGQSLPGLAWMCDKTLDAREAMARDGLRGSWYGTLYRRREAVAERVMPAPPLNPDRLRIERLPRDWPGQMPITWLDNDRLLFLSVSGIPPSQRKRMAVWDVRKGTIEDIEAFPWPAHDFCYSEGRVAYEVIGEHHYHVIAGEFGKQTEVVRIARSKTPLTFSEVQAQPGIDTMNCALKDERYRRLKPLGIPLRRGDGVATWTRWPERHFRLLREPDLTPVVTVDRAVPQGLYGPVHVPFDGGYVIFQMDPPMRQERTEVFRFWPDGRTEWLAVPVTEALRAANHHVMTPQGFFYSSWTDMRRQGRTLGGIHRFHAGRHQSLLTGWPFGIEASPDGCRVAAGVASRNHFEDVRLSVIQACAPSAAGTTEEGR
jgi:hypothetical protein